VGERDGVARTDPEAAATGEVVDRPRDDPETHAVKLAEERGDLTGQRSVNERLEEDRFGAVLALMHRDELAEHRIRVFSARSPSLDTADQTLRPPPQRRIDEAFLRRRVQVDRAGSDVSASRHLAYPEVRVSAARDLAQGGGLDGRRRSRRPAGSFALNVPAIRYKPSVSE
jgi:hypothetical protein